MTESVRNLFMSAQTQTQSHVSHVVWQAAKTSFLASYRNGNLSSEVYNEVKLDLVESEGRDITEVAKLFRKRCRFFANNFEERTGTILGIMRFVAKNDAQLLKNSSGLTHKNVQTLYDRLRELDPLIQNLRYYRNFFSHNFSNVEQFGWAVSVLVSVIRLCEIALVGKKDHEKNQKIISLFRKELSSLHQSTSSVTSIKISPNHDDRVAGGSLKYILDEIKSSESAILKKLDNLSVLASASKQSQMQGPQASAPTLSDDKNKREIVFEESVNEETEFDSEFSEESNLSPEILRHELRLISDKIKEEFGNKPGFGATRNLLQLANIGAILEFEPINCRNFLALPIVKARVDLDSPLIKTQLDKYEIDINKLLTSVLWLSAFEE